MLGGVRLGDPFVAANELRFTTRRSDSGASAAGGGSRSYAAIIDAPSGEMPIGDYLILATYEAGGNTVTDSIRFQNRWVDMPLTLGRIEYAIRALYPIASDETLDTLMSGDSTEQAQALDRFWSRRDPTPATRFNEAMAEYYRRADYARFNFRTIGQKDGVFTDRAKIYLLYGEPTEINREMQQEGPPREVWTYRNQVAQEFVFLDESRTGEYRLVEYHNL
jgi:GWxTD domain-containing protein